MGKRLGVEPTSDAKTTSALGSQSDKYTNPPSGDFAKSWAGRIAQRGAVSALVLTYVTDGTGLGSLTSFDILYVVKGCEERRAAS